MVDAAVAFSSVAVVDVEGAAQALEGAPALEVLRWAATQAGRVTFATGFGPEGCVVIDLIARHGLPIDVFTLDTGLLFPETRSLWRALEARYGIVIRGVEPEQSVEVQEKVLGPALWEHNPNQCCEIRKLRPLRRELAGFDAWITAIRRDQTLARRTAGVVERDPKFGLAKINPLVAWTHEDVWRYLDENDVPRNELHAHGYPSIGCQPCTSPVIPGENLRAGRWRGTTKTECGLHGTKGRS